MSLVFAWWVLAFVFAVSHGFYSALGVWLLVVAAGAVYLPPRSLSAGRAQYELALWGAALLGGVVTLLATVLGRGLRHHVAWTEPWIGGAQLLMVMAILAYARPVRAVLPTWAARYRFPAVVGAAGVTGLFAIAGAPDPNIDVFNFLNEGAAGLLQGQNPYAMQFTPPHYKPIDPAYHFDVYSYLPGTLLLTIPSVPLRDVRWVMLVAALLSALLMRALCLRLLVSEDSAELVAVAFLAYPGLLLVLEKSWPEPLTVCLWLAALWTQLGARCSWATGLSGLFLSVKQYNPPLLLPVLTAGMGRMGVIVSFLVPLVLCGPFIIWGPKDFWWDAFWFQVQHPAFGHSLSLNAYLLNEGRGFIPGWLSIGAPIVGAAYAAWVLRKRWEVAESLRLTVGFYFLLFLFNKFAFPNYYFLLQTVLLVAIVAVVGQAKDTRPPADALTSAASAADRSSKPR